MAPRKKNKVAVVAPVVKRRVLAVAVVKKPDLMELIKKQLAVILNGTT